MNIHLLTLGFVAAAALTTAQPQPGAPPAWAPRGAGMRQPWQQAGKPEARWAAKRDKATTRIVQMLKHRLELTAEQEKKATEILERAKADLGDRVGGLRSLGEKTRDELRAILTDEQKKKLDAILEAAGEALRGMAETYGPAVRERLEAAGEGMRLRVALNTLTLSDEQKEKLRKVESEFRDKHRAIMDEVKPKVEALREETRKKMEEILTPEQREQLEKRLKEMPPPGAGRGREGHVGPRMRRGAQGPLAGSGPAAMGPWPPAPMVAQAFPPPHQGFVPPPPMEFGFAPAPGSSPAAPFRDEPRFVPSPQGNFPQGSVPDQPNPAVIPPAPPRPDPLLEIFG